MSFAGAFALGRLHTGLCHAFLVCTFYSRYPRRRFFSGVCMFVYRHDISKPMQLGSPNLTYNCSMMSFVNRFILVSKGHRSRSNVCVDYERECNIAAGCICKPCWVFVAAVLHCTSHASDTRFSLHYFPWTMLLPTASFSMYHSVAR